jgi:DNA-directed RNA polymerase I and III subunit RPAC2
MSVNEVKIRPAPVKFELRGTGPPTSRTFVIGDEDHTLGNALRHVLINDGRVDFAGYCVPHPSEPVVHVRVQTAAGGEEGNSNNITAVQAVKEACETLEKQCDFVLEELEKALPEVREDREWMEKFQMEELQVAAEDEDDE